MMNFSSYILLSVRKGAACFLKFKGALCFVPDEEEEDGREPSTDGASFRDLSSSNPGMTSDPDRAETVVFHAYATESFTTEEEGGRGRDVDGVEATGDGDDVASTAALGHAHSLLVC